MTDLLQQEAALHRQLVAATLKAEHSPRDIDRALAADKIRAQLLEVRARLEAEAGR